MYQWHALIFFWPNSYQGVEIVGAHTEYKRIDEPIVCPWRFLKFAHKLQGGTQDGHLLNLFFSHSLSGIKDQL